VFKAQDLEDGVVWLPSKVPLPEYSSGVGSWPFLNGRSRSASNFVTRYRAFRTVFTEVAPKSRGERIPRRNDPR